MVAAPAGDRWQLASPPVSSRVHARTPCHGADDRAQGRRRR